MKPIYCIRNDCNEINRILSRYGDSNELAYFDDKFDQIHWTCLSLNTSDRAIELLEQNQDKIHWYNLSSNPNALEILIANPDNIDWYYLSSNPNAIELLKVNVNKINLDNLSKNSAIFIYDYDFIKDKNKELNEEIIYKSLHPKRMLRLMEEYGEDEIYSIYFE